MSELTAGMCWEGETGKWLPALGGPASRISSGHTVANLATVKGPAMEGRAREEETK